MEGFLGQHAGEVAAELEEMGATRGRGSLQRAFGGRGESGANGVHELLGESLALDFHGGGEFGGVGQHVVHALRLRGRRDRLPRGRVVLEPFTGSSGMGMAFTLAPLSIS